MQIQKDLSTPYNPYFSALHVAKCGEFDLYKLNEVADYKFIKTLPKKVDFETLMPGLKKESYSRWAEMLEYAVDNSSKPKNVTYVEAVDGKICGIITYNPDKTTMLDCICTWPVELGQKVKFAGKALFYQMFQDALDLKVTRVILEAITNGPFNTVEKYKSIGFAETSKVYPTKVVMEINKYKIKDALDMLKSLLQYRKVSRQRINLSDLAV